MTDFTPLHSALYESTPEEIAAALRYLRKADAVMAALMPLSANPPLQPAQVPESYALVPVEPTEAMLDAGHAAAWRRIPSCFDMTDAEIVYRAMLAAAPLS